MTILAALRNRAAIVLGSDSEERSASGRRRTTKLVVPQRDLVLAWAGYKDVAQALALSLQRARLDLRRWTNDSRSLALAEVEPERRASARVHESDPRACAAVFGNPQAVTHEVVHLPTSCQPLTVAYR